MFKVICKRDLLPLTIIFITTRIKLMQYRGIDILTLIFKNWKNGVYLLFANYSFHLNRVEWLLQEQRKSAQLEESMTKLDLEMKRTDSLLYQMIPRQVAEKLRRGEPATSTCEVPSDYVHVLILLRITWNNMDKKIRGHPWFIINQMKSMKSFRSFLNSLFVIHYWAITMTINKAELLYQEPKLKLIWFRPRLLFLIKALVTQK